MNSNYCLINTEISATCSACGPQLDAISKFGQLAWAAVFHLLKTDRHLRDLQAEEGAGICLKDLPSSLGKEHMVQNHGKEGVLCLHLLIKGSPIPEEGHLGCSTEISSPISSTISEYCPGSCSRSPACFARRMCWVNHSGK